MRRFAALNAAFGLTALTTLASASTSQAAPSSGNGEAGTQHYTCGSTRPPNRDAEISFAMAGTNLYAGSGSATSCSINGLIHAGELPALSGDVLADSQGLGAPPSAPKP
ncbi:hypothetical protein [Actinocrispum sp. NPDC049592]|uniref:hypothetical protein n=1 Tax=Actinocrispum sp. NPDC049592 TaxID=3154835 RepID=UPI00343ED3D7